MGSRSIRFYFIVLLAIVLVTTVAAAWFVRAQTSRDSRRSAFAEAHVAADTGARELARYVSVVQGSIGQLAANPKIGQAITHPAGCTLSFSGLSGVDQSHLDVIAPDGSVTCSSHPKQAGHLHYGGAPWLSASLAKPQFFGPVVDRGTGRHAMVITVPVAGRKGTVAAFVDLDSAGPALAALFSGGHEDEFLVLSADGRTVLARSIASRQWVGKHVTMTGFRRAAGSAELKDLDGDSRLYAATTVAGTGWHLFAGERTHAALAASARLQRREFAIILAGLIAALIAAAIAHRSLVAPIRRLRSALTSGPQQPEPIPASGPVELRQLTDDINALIDSVDRELGERQRAEQQLAASERSYRLLFEGNPSPMWVFDAETLTFLAVNDAAVRAYGFSREEFLSMTIEEIRPTQELARLHGVVASTADGRGLNLSGVWRHRRKDGTLFDVEIVSQDHVFEGRSARIVLALDVTERYEAEQALRRSEARYRDLFENATDMIATVGLDTRFTNVNAAFTRILGYEADELIGKPLSSIVPAEWHGQLDAARGDKLEGDSGTVYMHELTSKDGRHIPVEVATRIIYEDGVATGIEAICRDLSERQQLEEQLRQSQRIEAVGRLAGGVAHDFNNLLTVISGYSELLIEKGNGNPDRALLEIAAAADRATVLTRQLLAFSRRQVLQPRVVDLNEVVLGVTPMLQRLIGEDVQLEALLAPGAGRVLADPSQIEQVVVNLVVNARDAMPDGGKLTISTGRTELDQAYVDQHPEATVGPHAMLAVSDTGTGMDAATMASIFEPFFTTKPAGVGTGLGLSTVYGIVKQSNGTIWCYSEPDRGTTFKVYLPSTAADVPAVSSTPAQTAPATGSETILVVEDEDAVRELVVQTLAECGYHVLAAESSNEALRIATNGEHIELVLTDLVMPGLSGQELADRIREQRPDIRLLFMSGYADEAVSRNGTLEPGAVFIEKPFTAKRLAIAVRGVLDHITA